MKLCEAEYFELVVTGEYLSTGIVRHAFIIACPCCFSDDEEYVNACFEEWLREKVYYRHLIPHFPSC